MIDYQPLLEKPSSQNVAAFRRYYKQNFLKLTRLPGRGLVVSLAFVFIAVVVLYFAVIANPEREVGHYIVVGAMFLLGCIGFLLSTQWIEGRWPRRPTKWLTRLWLFAQANGGKYTGGVSDTIDLIVGDVTMQLRNEYAGTSLERENVSSWYAVPSRVFSLVKLTKSLPHTLVGTNVSAFDQAQQVQLPGIYKGTLRLFVENGHKHDVSSVFTSDVLEIAAQYSDTYSIEIVGDQMYIFDTKSYFGAPMNRKGEQRSIDTIKQLIQVSVQLAGKVETRA